MLLGIDTVATDQQAFVGADGSRLEAIASRLTAGNASLATTEVVVRSGIEVRASGDLRVSADWNLPTTQPLRATAPHAGDTSLTIRAAGNLLVDHSVSAGFVRNPIDTADLADSERGGSITLVAGADLSAAEARRTLASSTAGVTLGRANAPVSVRTTTGDLGVFAAGDIAWVNNQATIYSAGRPVSAPVSLDALINDLPTIAGVEGGTPFLADGGAVTVSAGRDITGAPVSAERPSVADWWWRGANFGSPRIWWSRTDLFDQGIASFAGGSVSVQAGRDLTEVHASSAGNGIRAETGELLFEQRGGNVALSAGRDIVNGAAFAGGDSLSVKAGGSIRREAGVGSGEPGLQLVHERTAVKVEAASDIVLGSVRDAGALQPAVDNQTGIDTLLVGFGTPSSLSVTSAAGDIVYRGAEQPVSTQAGSLLDAYRLFGRVLPGDVSFAAPGGGIRTEGQSTVLPSPQGGVRLLAQDDVNLAAGGITLTATPGVQERDRDVASAGLELARLERLIASRLGEDGGLDTSDRQPVRFVSTEGDVRIDGVLSSVRPVRLLAGEDLLLGPSGRIVVQHQPGANGTSELSLLQAGGDIVALATSAGRSGIEVGGPGDIVLLAGGNVDFGASNGITSSGNRDNSAVLERPRAADITVVAGLRADGEDYRRAAREGFALLGAAPLAQRAGDLFALLSGTGANPGSPAAQAFAALPLAEQLAQVRGLLGDSGYERAAIGFVHGLPGQAGLSDAQALQAFAALPAASQRLGLGAMLTHRLGALDAAERQRFVAALAQLDDSAQARAQRDAFGAYVVAAGGPRSDDLAATLAAFEALPLERQAVWLNRALVGEVRRYGREASTLAGSERNEAYANAYLSIDALFPWSDGTAGDIRLPTSQIRTAQEGDITLFAERGGINAGALGGAAGARAADLGIITVAGGNVSSLVRDSFEVNQSRVFSLARGDILIWASEGNIDAGRGAKTVTGAPAPTLRLDSEGRLTLDTSGSFSGSGIAVLDAGSALDLYAPQGEINAGEAGIKSVGQAFFATLNFRGADDIKVGGGGSGGPPAAPPPPSAAGLSAQAAATSAGTRAEGEESEEDKRKKRRVRRNLLLDFLGFGAERG